MKVLFPTDFSDQSKNALPFAVDLCKKLNAKLSVLNTYDLPYSENSFNGARLLESVQENAETNMKQFEKELVGLRIDFSTTVLMGNPVRIIKEKAKKPDIAYVVMGTKGSSGIEEILIGSNAASVITATEVPVLIIPPQAHFTAIKKMLYCSELKASESANTLKQLSSFAQIYGVHIDIMHIQGESAEANGRRIFEEAFKSISHSYTIVKEQEKEEAILQHAIDTKADIIASMTKKYGFFEGLFHSSLTKQLAFHTTMPLLALHQK